MCLTEYETNIRRSKAELAAIFDDTDTDLSRNMTLATAKRPILKGAYPQLDRVLDTAAIYELLGSVLDAERLSCFCFDYFPDVYDEFTADMKSSRRMRKLIEYCKHHQRLWLLVGYIYNINPSQYVKFLPSLIKPMLDKLESGDENHRVMATKVLGLIQEPLTIPYLEDRLLREYHPNVGYWIAISIGRIGGIQAKDTLIRLKTQLKANQVNPFVLKGIEQALERINSQSI